MLPISTEVLEAAAIAGAALVVFSIVRLLRVLRESILARLAAVSEQDVRFPAEGRVVLCIEAPHFSTPFAGVGFTMRDDHGHEVPSTPIVFRSKVSGFSRVRLSVRVFDVPRAGRYRLVASGIVPGRDMAEAAIDGIVALTTAFARASLAGDEANHMKSRRRAALDYIDAHLGKAQLGPEPRPLGEVAGVVAVVTVPDPAGVGAGLFFDEQ